MNRVSWWSVLLAGAVLLASLGWSNTVFAQISNTPDLEKLVAGLGQRFDGEVLKKTIGAYMQLQAGTPKDGVRITRDLSYGSDELQKVDVFQPTSKAEAPRPVVVFVHGGGFVGGDKSRGGLIYDNVLYYFARHGVVGVNANYRLAPKHPFPAGVEDMRGIVTWVGQNIDAHGGDPARIYLMGHSAGAAHVAAYAFMEEYQANGGNDGVKGAILVSGQYGIVPAPPFFAYYGKDKSQWPGKAPIDNIKGRRIPLFIIDAQYDPWLMQGNGNNLIFAICARDGRCPRHLRLAGHNHISMTTHMNSADESLGPPVLDFIRKGR